MHRDGRTYWAIAVFAEKVFWRACTGNIWGKSTV